MKVRRTDWYETHIGLSAPWSELVRREQTQNDRSARSLQQTKFAQEHHN